MKTKQVSKVGKKSYSPFEKRQIVEEVRSGYYSLGKARKKYILSKTKFNKWNRWYFKIRLLRHFTPKASSIMKKSDHQIEQLKRQLLEAQALNKKLELKNMALETMIDIAEKNLQIDIRKKRGSKQSKN